MSLIEQIKKDLEQITGNTAEFAVNLSFKSPANDTAEITGISADISTGRDEDGIAVVGKFVHVTFSEQYLIDLGYPTRNSMGLLSMLGHLVTISYADGSTKKFMVDSCRPDYTINLHTLILSDYNGTN